MENYSNNYYIWLINKFGLDIYTALCFKLYNKEFYWGRVDDSSRANDGLRLRREYTQETGCVDAPVGPCRLLEMMLGLAITIEERLMYDKVLGDRTYDWFINMLDNLGISVYTNNHWDESIEHYVDQVIDILLERRYDWNGAGGLYPLQSAKNDQRFVNIWWQMQAYMAEYYTSY